MMCFYNRKGAKKKSDKVCEAWSRMQTMIKEMNTWELVTSIPDKTLISCKWVFIMKHKVEGSIEISKLRLVAKGFAQTYGVDYQKILSQLLKWTLRMLSRASSLDWYFQRFDVKNVFFHRNLIEEAYMVIPIGFDTEQTQRKVCGQKKFLEGLKQSPRAWFHRSAMWWSPLIPTKQCWSYLFIKHQKDRNDMKWQRWDDLIEEC